MRVVIFSEPGYQGDKLFMPCENDWHKSYVELRRVLESKGFTVESWHGNINIPTVDIEKDIGLYSGLPLYPCPMTKRSVSIQLEPPIIPGRARFYEKIHGLPFNRILTYVKHYVDNVRIFYEVMPYVPCDAVLSPVRDKYICAISGGDKGFPSVTIDGYTYQSLYDARKKAYIHFGKELDLYGKGWDAKDEVLQKVNFMGPCDNKVSTMSRYKYAIVFENVDNLYTTEKYWDAIRAGCSMSLPREGKNNLELYWGKVPEEPMSFYDYRQWALRVAEHVEAVA